MPTTDDAPRARMEGRPTRLCGCGRCTTVHFRLAYASRFVDVAPIFSNTTFAASSWLDAVLVGSAGVYAAPVSASWTALGTSSVRVLHAGTYAVQLSVIHENDSFALGLEAGRQQREATHCPLLTGNGATANVTVPRCPHWRSLRTECLAAGVDEPRWVVSPTPAEADIHLDGVPLRFHGGAGSAEHDPVASSSRCLLLGDSHTYNMHVYLHLHNGSFRAARHRRLLLDFREDGKGIYHNVVPDTIGIRNYAKGRLKAAFRQGDMLQRLSNGSYDELQRELNYSTWLFQSGHWDLRDADVGTYMWHAEELFAAFSAFEARFRNSATPLRLVWLGVPAYAHKRSIWGGMELRTNVKLHLADVQIAHLASLHGVDVVPFFSLSYPVHGQSCDDHHYLCVRDDRGFGVVGQAYVQLVLSACARTSSVEAIPIALA
jgi:hypothetical protein